METLAGHGIPFDSTKPHCQVQRIIGLTTAWAHPCQSCFQALEEAALKLMLLADESQDWPYVFIWLNNAISHAPLLNEGHINTMMDGVDTHGQLHQLQICKLLQHGSRVVCPEGLNSELEALQITFLELPLWDAAAPGEPF